MEKLLVGVQISVQAFNETVRILQELPYRTVADVMVLLRQNQPVYAPDKNPVDDAASAAVKSKAPDDAPADTTEES